MGILSSGLFLFILCVTVGWYASTLNRNSIAWAIISVFITPFLASMLLLIMGDPTKPKELK